MVYHLNGKIWIEKEGEKVLGPGRIELLERIKATGSIRQAAAQMKMSYKQAWDIIHHMNTALSDSLVIAHRGGKGGGHAEVTPYGQKVIGNYISLKEKFDAFITAIEAETDF